MPADTATTAAISVRIGPSVPRFLVDARKGRASTLGVRLAELCSRSNAGLFLLAPGRWQVIFDVPVTAAAELICIAAGPDGAVFDVTGGYLTARVCGTDAASLLSRAVRIDLARFPVGQAAQVEAHGVSVQIRRTADHDFAVTAPRSTAAGLFDLLFPSTAT